MKYREKHGDFKSIEDVKNVRSVSERDLKKIIDVVTVASSEGHEVAVDSDDSDE